MLGAAREGGQVRPTCWWRVEGCEECAAHGAWYIRRNRGERGKGCSFAVVEIKMFASDFGLRHLRILGCRPLVQTYSEGYNWTP